MLLPVSQHKLIFVECKYPASLNIKYAKYNAIENVVRGLKGEIIKGELVPLTSKKEIFYNASNLIYESLKTNGVLTMVDNYFEYEPKTNQNFTKVTFITQSIENLKEIFPKVITFF